MKPKQLYKTVIEIWTDYPTDKVELEDLARDAIGGDAYCNKQECEVVCNEKEFPDTEFFDWDE
jgi:hypothetical protein